MDKDQIIKIRDAVHTQMKKDRDAGIPINYVLKIMCDNNIILKDSNEASVCSWNDTEGIVVCSRINNGPGQPVNNLETIVAPYEYIQYIGIEASVDYANVLHDLTAGSGSKSDLKKVKEALASMTNQISITGSTGDGIRWARQSTYKAMNNIVDKVDSDFPSTPDKPKRIPIFESDGSKIE